VSDGDGYLDECNNQADDKHNCGPPGAEKHTGDKGCDRRQEEQNDKQDQMFHAVLPGKLYFSDNSIIT
jgi:hypothetical protein